MTRQRVEQRRRSSAVLALVLLLLEKLPTTVLGFSSSTTTTVTPQSSQNDDPPCFLGVDLGTSGARLSIIRQEEPSSSDTTNHRGGYYNEIFAQAVAWDIYGTYDDPDAWMKAVQALLQGAADRLSLASVQAICISGTSASCLLVEPVSATGGVAKNDDDDVRMFVKPSRGSTARMYNYNVDNPQVLQWLEEYAPPRHTARSPTGSLAKLLAWHAEQPLSATERLCHQADYVIRQFLHYNPDNDDEQPFTISSDWHNCLKLGYDVRALQWPDWLSDGLLPSLGLSSATTVLPSPVVSPGQPVGRVAAWACRQFGLSPQCVLTGGTTDSNAAFFAAALGQGGVVAPGTAVTSLGSTLAIKQLSESYVEDADRGVYSHRYPSVLVGNDSSQTEEQQPQQQEAWLVGGASNSGCAVLRAQDFSNEELVELSRKLDPNKDSPLQYYPLTQKGERFPVADSKKEPILEPVPDTRGEFLQGILQGISDVERDGFRALGELGASPSTPHQVWTCGGGSRNDVWSQMRQRRLRQAFGNDQVSVARADNVEASYGAAILAAASFTNSKNVPEN